MISCGMVLDPDDIWRCDRHAENFMTGEDCPRCEEENSFDCLTDRISKLESFLRAAINDGGASKNLKDCARDLLAE
jgi:hypothetical protein